MLDSEKLGIAAHLHVAMRRKVGRVIDVEWVVRNDEYAREVIRIAMAEAQHPELQEWARRLQAALFPAPVAARALTVAPAAPPPATVMAAAPRYVGRLR